MADENSNLRIVGIGASAGGIDPLKEFFRATPSDSGVAFVVVQHLDPSHASYMAGLLGKCTEMKVVQAEEGMPADSNRIYTIPPGKFLLLKDGKLRLSEPVKRDGLRMPIDFFFRSLAEDQREKAIAVVFSGSGSDGTLGIREIRGAGGVVFAQDPDTAEFDSMIESAVSTGLVDYVLPVREITATILQYARQTSLRPMERPTREPLERHILSILDLLLSEAKTDFRSYKESTIRRRILRRMGLNRIEDISDYYRFLRSNPDELAKLAKDLLIGVTSFFRDENAFEELRAKVIAPLIREKGNNDALRVWVAGCSTGEEPYSIAILFIEEMEGARKALTLQVYATDIDREGLKSARAGIYPASIAADVSEERLGRFFVKTDSTYQIDRRVRDVVTFADHNLLLNPPFINMDLVSCRNLFIYIRPEAQRKVLNVFAFALKRDGYLFLGKSDTVAEQSDLLEPLSQKFRIFRRKPSAAAPRMDLSQNFSACLQPIASEAGNPIKLSDLNQQVLLKHFNASIVLVNEGGAILHFYGPSQKYLVHPYGAANLNLLDMIEKRGSLMLRQAFEKASRENSAVKVASFELNRENPDQPVSVTIIPVMDSQSGRRLFAVIFEEAKAPAEILPPGGEKPEEQGDPDDVTRLQAENKALRLETQATIESYQTTHEELMAANEEVHAINEELQSTNEELETSKEELQSVNEELVTVNNQLNDKLEELNQLNDDLTNFLDSSEVGTLFLDRGFCIRRFTPSATKRRRF